MTVPGLQQFLSDYPGMRVLPVTSTELVLEGDFEFGAITEGRPEIGDSYCLRIRVPEQFPAEIPTVVELEERIPRSPDWHVNPDGSLCLGSPLRLLMKLASEPTLAGFASRCLVPYLYATTHKAKFGGPFPFSELKHGRTGELEDYMELLALKRPEQVQRAIRLLGMKKRHANKEACPCDCGQRLGKCAFNKRLNRIRQLTNRSWFQRIGR